MPKRRLAAIMFTDIVGYTALMGKDSAKALELVRINREIQKPLVEKHGGKWLKEMGDGAMAQFNTALDAVNCAVEIQKSARGDLDAKLRIGIHSGDITIENDDVYGDGVNVAARLESIADPGGIYISESIEKAIQGQTGIQAKYLGEIKLKNVAYGVRTYAVQGVGLPVPQIKNDQQLKGHFWAEVQRRGLVRTGAVYLVLSLLVVLLLPYAESIVDLPDWAATALLGILIVGFPIAMYLAWNYERSPEGFVRTTSQQSWQNPYSVSQRKPFTGTFIIAGLVGIIVIMYLYPRFLSGDQSQQSLVTDKSIAVLPFKNDSPDKDNQYFCDGMMDEILNHLQKIAELGVKSRTAVEIYRDSPKSFAAIAQELDVAYILEGAVRKYGENFRITTQLIEVKSENHLWSETYDGIFSDTIFVVQSNIAKKIASSMSAVISPEVEESIDKIPTSDVTAYDYILQARQEQWKYWGEGDTTALKRAEMLYDKVLKLDPEYALGWVKKGSIYFDRHNYTEEYFEKNYLDSVLWYCDKAITFDPDNNAAYLLMGMAFHKRGNIDRAIINYQKAIVLSQDDASTIWETSWRLGYIYLFKKDYINGVTLIKKAVQKARGSPQDYRHMLYRLGMAYMYIGAFEEAKIYFDKDRNLGGGCLNMWSMELFQGNFQASLDYLLNCCTNTGCNYHKAHNYLQVKEYEKSVEHFRKSRNWTKDSGTIQSNNLYREGFALIQIGLQEEGNVLIEKQLAQLDKRKKLGRSDGYDYHYAAIYASSGDHENALRHLRDYEESVIYPNPIINLIPIGFIQHDIMFENLWDNEEFKAFIKRDKDKKAAIRVQVREMEERGEIDL